MTPAPLATEYVPDASLLFRRGVEALRANDFAAAIELLSRGCRRSTPSDPQGQIPARRRLAGRGAARRRTPGFEAAQAALADDPAPVPSRRGLASRARRQSGRAGRGERSLLARAQTRGGALRLWPGFCGARRASARRAGLRRRNPIESALGRRLGQLRARALSPGRGRGRQDRDAPGARRRSGPFRRRSPILAPSCGSPARRRGPSGSCGRRVARAPDAVGARLNLAADLLQEERAAEALALLDGAEPPSDARGFAPLASPSRLWPCCSSAARRKRATVLDDLARWVRPRPRSRRSCTGASSCWRSPRATARAPARRRSDGAGARRHGPGRRSRARHHGALRSRQILVRRKARRAAPSPIGSKATSCSRGSSRSRARRTAPSSTRPSRRSARRG